MKKFVIVLFFFSLSQICFTQVHTEIRQFYSNALNQNRTFYVYRPDTTVYNYPLPVMVFLPGLGMPPSSFPALRSQLENLLNSGQIYPMLIVIPDGRGGIYSRSMYWNSPGVNGLYGDFIANETINFVKNNYNVIQDSGSVHFRNAFIIGGFSMGGGGAFRVGYKWGDVFSGIASFSGDIEHQYLFTLAGLSPILTQARTDSNGYIFTPPDPSRTLEYAFWGMASAFSPDTTAQYTCQFPLREGDGSIIDSARTKWLEAGPVYLADIHYQTYDQNSMKLFIATDANDPWFGGAFAQSFVTWLNQSYPQVPLNYHIHSYGHSMPPVLIDSMLIWSNKHFKANCILPARANAIYINRSYLNNGIDTLKINATVNNSNNHNVELYAMIKSINGSFADSLMMYDDGMHNDILANDGIFGNSMLAPIGEDEFMIGLKTIDLDMNVITLIDDLKRFTTMGPVEINSCSEIMRASNFIFYNLELINNGTTASAQNVHAVVSISDPFATGILNNNQTFGTIGAGQTAVSSGNFRVVTTNLPINHTFVFHAEIFSNGNLFWEDSTSVVVGISKLKDQVPQVFSLQQNYPNPFNPKTTIEFSIPKAEYVELKIFDVTGRKVQTLVSDNLNAGVYKYEWNTAEHIASGIYYYAIKAGEFTDTKKLVLIK